MYEHISLRQPFFYVSVIGLKVLINIRQRLIVNANFLMAYTRWVFIIQLCCYRYDTVYLVFFDELQIRCCLLVSQEQPSFRPLWAYYFGYVISKIFVELNGGHRLV